MHALARSRSHHTENRIVTRAQRENAARPPQTPLARLRRSQALKSDSFKVARGTSNPMRISLGVHGAAWVARNGDFPRAWPQDGNLAGKVKQLQPTRIHRRGVAQQDQRAAVLAREELPMAVFTLDNATLSLLASCLHVGFEGSPDPANAGDDVAAVAALLDELDAISGAGAAVEITVIRA